MGANRESSVLVSKKAVFSVNAHASYVVAALMRIPQSAGKSNYFAVCCKIVDFLNLFHTF